MQFRDLGKQYEVLRPQIDYAIASTIEKSTFIGGESVRNLEKELAEYVGVKYCISCANGTDALTAALMAWDIGVGDAVFVPDFTFFSTGEIVAFEGATPVFVDVDENTFNISVDSLEYQIKKVIEEGKLRPKAVIPVDLFGLPADYEKIYKVAKQYNLLILEDGAQGFGGELYGKKACSFGNISTTSFFPAKPLGCYGDGGAIFTDDEELQALLRSICVHGKGTMKYDNVRIGMNSRLDTIQAAILSVKLKAFSDFELQSVNKVAEQYTEQLAGIVKTPGIAEGYLSSWAQYTIQLNSCEERDNLQATLRENGIPTMVYYPKPMHCQKAFAELKSADEDYPNTIQLCNTVLSLPMHPYMQEEDVAKVVDNIKTVL